MKKRIVFFFVALSVMLAACGVKATATPSVQLVSPGVDGGAPVVFQPNPFPTPEVTLSPLSATPLPSSSSMPPPLPLSQTVKNRTS